MSKNLEIKKQLVEDIASEISKSGEQPSTVVFNYSQIGVNEINELRGKLSENGAGLKVVKNTLIKRILEKMGVSVENDIEGQNAILINQGSDIMAPLKTLFGFMKDTEKGAITLGVLNGRIISAEQVEALSKLPSREQLLGQVVGGMVSPVRGFMYALNGVSGNFVRVLGAIKDKKSSEA